jgi:hypothetical protein
VERVVHALSLGGLLGCQGLWLRRRSHSCHIRSRAARYGHSMLTGRSTRLPLLSPYENLRSR